MEAEIRKTETNTELSLAEPHFDDEATLLSARRVVPLDEVESDEPQKRWHLASGWMFVATVVGALLLGIAASAIYYSRVNREPAQSFVDAESIASGVDAISEPASNDARLTPTAPEMNNGAAPDANMDVTVNDRPTFAPAPEGSANETKRPAARRVGVLTSSSARDELKAARREAKERIRELERESRGRRSRNDLTRIREIFEGPQKP
ncbi:MAG: hypothetical protein ABJB61_05215 [bacterium]